MSVTLRRKKNGSYYLDIYERGRRRYEFLSTALKGIDTREHLKYAKMIRDQVARDILLGKYSVENAERRRADIIPLFDKYEYQAHYRVFRACAKQLQKFTKKNRIACREIDEEFCKRFKHHLNKVLNGDSPFNYFKVFKKVLSDATKQGYFQVSPAAEVKNENRSIHQLKKDVLNEDELIALYSTAISNQDVRRAFLFACQTGIRGVDLRLLTWKHVNMKERYIRFNQNKTGRQNIVPLNDNAMDLLKEIPTNRTKLFVLPSDNGMNKLIRAWASAAGIEKHLTFYVARHTFVTGILLATGNMKTASLLAGHTSTRMTERYLHVVDSVRRSAVDKLPALKVVKKAEEMG